MTFEDRIYASRAWLEELVTEQGPYINTPEYYDRPSLRELTLPVTA